jgi:hypothetical protein
MAEWQTQKKFTQHYVFRGAQPTIRAFADRIGATDLPTRPKK